MELEVPSTENLSVSLGFIVRSLPCERRKETWRTGEWSTTNINEEGNICSSAQENSTFPLVHKWGEYLLIDAAVPSV